MDPSWTDSKAAWMEAVLDEEGRALCKPLPCDWSRLNQLRQAQSEQNSQAQKKAEASLEPAQPQP